MHSGNNKDGDAKAVPLLSPTTNIVVAETTAGKEAGQEHSGTSSASSASTHDSSEESDESDDELVTAPAVAPPAASEVRVLTLFSLVSSPA